MKTTVLDASALLALLFDEPGAEKIESLFNQAAAADKPMLIAAVNWAEVLYKMQRKHGAKEDTDVGEERHGTDPAGNRRPAPGPCGSRGGLFL